MPYSFSAFGVLPPLWSRAAMKPSAFFTLLNCCSFMGSTLSSSVARHSRSSVKQHDTRQQRPLTGWLSGSDGDATAQLVQRRVPVETFRAVEGEDTSHSRNSNL